MSSYCEIAILFDSFTVLSPNATGCSKVSLKLLTIMHSTYHFLPGANAPSWEEKALGLAPVVMACAAYVRKEFLDDSHILKG